MTWIRQPERFAEDDRKAEAARAEAARAEAESDESKKPMTKKPTIKRRWGFWEWKKKKKG